MTDAIPLPFELPAVARKKLTVDFEGGDQSSDAGLLLLREAEKRSGVCRRLASAMPDRRDQSRIRHEMIEMVVARACAITCGYKDGNDFDRLRHEPLMKLAVGRCPQSGAPLASQSTISRLENAPRKTEAARVTGALVDQFTASVRPGGEEILDIDDTFCAAHGGQQMTFWNAHEDERGFAPMHIYHVASGTPVVAILRPARTPKGTEVRTVVKHVTKRIRSRWPTTKLIWRGDSHYGRVEAMEWAEANETGYIFGFAGNATLHKLVAEAAEHLCFRHAMSTDEKMRAYTSFEYQAKSWKRPRKIVARLEVSLQFAKDEWHQEMDIRYVVTSLDGDAQHLYDNVYCARGQAENLIKLHKAQLASDRTSCHSATANQVRLAFHTAAFWLMHTVRSAIPKTNPLAKAEFRTIRDRLMKIGARVIEHVARIRIHLPTSCPERALFRQIACGLMPGAS